MFVDGMTPQPHHYWWASILQTGMDYLRPFLKLSGGQDDAWNTTRRVIGDL